MNILQMYYTHTDAFCSSPVSSECCRLLRALGGPQLHVGTQVLEKGVEGRDKVLGCKSGGGRSGGRKEHYHVLLLTIKSLVLCLTRARVRALTHSSTLKSQNQLRISEKCGMYHRLSNFLPSLLSTASGRERCCLGSWIVPTEKRCPCDVLPPPLVTLAQTKKASRVAGKS